VGHQQRRIVVVLSSLVVTAAAAAVVAMGNKPAPGGAIARSNVDFFVAGLPCRNGFVTLHEMQAWRGNYSRLEHNHAFIQWLFPTRSKSALCVVPAPCTVACSL
jgi:hypothetical protein